MSEDITVRVFNQFYNADLVVDASQYDAVYAYFAGLTSNQRVAKTYTEILFIIANITGENTLDLLQTFQTNRDSMNALNMALSMAYYLNTLSPNKTVLYGVNNPIIPNETVQRNIVQ